MSNLAFHQQPLDDSLFKIRCFQGTRAFDFPPHYHTEVEMVYVKKGVYYINVMEKAYTLKAGQLAIIGSNHIHCYQGNEADSLEHEHYMLLFDWKFFSHMFTEEADHKLLYPTLFGIHIIECYKEDALAFVGESMAQLSVETYNHEEAMKVLLVGELYKLIGGIIRHSINAIESTVDVNQLKEEHKMLSQVNEYIIREYTKGIHLTDIASALGYSDYHFSRQFKRYIGVTFKKYLIHYQVSMAREQVVEQGIAITDIAFNHGFNSVKTFNRVFKAYYNMSPTEYRRLETAKNEK